MQKIAPFLWFEKNTAKEVADYYLSIFGENANVKDTTKLEDTPSGTVSVITLVIFGQEFTSMSAGPFEKFSAATSFVINCETQEEIDYYWNAFCKEGEVGRCGWLKDKFGVSWQVVPAILATFLGDNDKEKSARAMQAMLKMNKIIIADIEVASKIDARRLGEKN